MSDIKKTALVILIIVILSNTFTQYAYAATDVDHNAMMQYEGYGQAMYESVVEQTTFLTGQYTDNKDYVNSTMNEIKDYANFWYNEYNDFTSSCYQSSAMNCLGEMFERGGAYALTVGDWFKKLFGDYEETQEQPSTELDFSHYEEYMEWVEGNASQYIKPKTGYKLQLRIFGSLYEPSAVDLDPLVLPNDKLNVYFTSSLYVTYPTENRAEALAIRDEIKSVSDLSGALNWLNKLGAVVGIKDIELSVPTVPPLPPVNRISNYLKENSLPTIPVPQLKPQLVCPNGTRISMNVSGSTFLAVDGTVMMVAKDGTAEVNGQICNLNWQKPTVEYDPDGKAIVTNPDGTKTNLDTGDTTQKPPPDSTDLEGCTGVMCGIGKLLDGLGSVVSSIADMVKDLLEGLIKLFVPEDLSFLKDEFSSITKKLNEKIPITKDLKEAIEGLFEGGGNGNPLANISINLPITNEPLSFGNVSFIEEGVPILRRVAGAIVVLYTIAYVYRKITGRGGVMER